MKNNDPSRYYQSYLYIGYVWVAIVLIMLFLTSCTGTYYITESELVIDDYDRVHSTQVYYYNDLPYWGYYSGYYYYYGTPHLYPWWYYYTLMPHHTYSVHTHVSIYCNNGYYVSKPRGPKFNNKRGGTYKPTNTVTVKPNRGNIRTNIKTNTNRTNIKTNTNRTNIKTNTNKVNIRTNKNRSNKNNVKINRNNSNKSNNKTFNNRSNKRNIKTNTRKPR